MYLSCFLQNLIVGLKTKPEHEFSLIIYYIPVCTYILLKMKKVQMFTGIGITLHKESFLLEDHRLHLM